MNIVMHMFINSYKGYKNLQFYKFTKFINYILTQSIVLLYLALRASQIAFAPLFSLLLYLNILAHRFGSTPCLLQLFELLEELSLPKTALA